MTTVATDYDSAQAALTRLIPIAMSDTGQSKRVADFLMAWWNGPDLGHFQIADMFGLDVAIAMTSRRSSAFLDRTIAARSISIASASPRRCKTSWHSGGRRRYGPTPDTRYGSKTILDYPDGAEGRASERRWRALLGRTAEEGRGSEKVFGQGVRAN